MGHELHRPITATKLTIKLANLTIKKNLQTHKTMKKLALTFALVSMTAAGAFAQGQLIFENYFGSGNTNNAPVKLSDGVTLASGTSYLADLIYGSTAGTVTTDAGFARAFSTGTGAGFFLGGAQQIGSSAGTYFMEVVVWQASAGASWSAATGGTGLAADYLGSTYGIGNVFSENLPASPTPGVNFAGLITGFTLQSTPEPATLALGGLGAAALLMFRRRK